MAAKFDWKKYEMLLAGCIIDQVAAAMESYPNEAFYAAGFHSFYRESGDLIALPCLAVNTEEELDGDEDCRWSAPDWYWDNCDYESKSLSQLHTQLNEEASRLDVDHWSRTHDQWMSALIRVAKAVTSRLKRRKPTTKDFGFYLFDEESDECIDVLRKCMSASKFKRLFPRLQSALDAEKADAKLPASKRLERYRDDLWEHREKLVSLGADAIPMLVGLLGDKDQGWKAAGILGEIGIPDSSAIKKLRYWFNRTSKRSPRWHEATALAFLGDIDFLLSAAKKAKTRSDAINGIKGLYSSLAEDRPVHFPLNYIPLERLLEDPVCRKLAERDSVGGSVYALQSRNIKSEDVDEAVRGTSSKSIMIRQHAVRCLGDRHLGKAVSERAMQAIVDRFTDRDDWVRFLAIVCLGRWKKMAKPHLPDIRRAMRKDLDPDVRSEARHLIKKLGHKP